MAAIGGLRGQQHWVSAAHIDSVGRDAIRVALEGGELTPHQLARRIGYGRYQIQRWLDAMPEVEPAGSLDGEQLYRLRPSRPAPEPLSQPRASSCGCACASGGFCGGCGHAGCGRRR